MSNRLTNPDIQFLDNQGNVNCRTPKPLPSQEELLALLRYERETGKLFWRERSRSMFTSDRIWRAWNSRCADAEAFTATTAAGYRLGAINGALFYAHRVIIKMLYGVDAPEVDHERGNRSDNRDGSISPANRQKNGKNTARRSDNTSGVTGVFWATRDRRWVAKICIDQKSVNLGHFVNKEHAVAARKVAEAKYGFHPNHGRVAA